jgi:hypothetical protein
MDHPDPAMYDINPHYYDNVSYVSSQLSGNPHWDSFLRRKRGKSERNIDKHDEQDFWNRRRDRLDSILYILSIHVPDAFAVSGTNGTGT